MKNSRWLIITLVLIWVIVIIGVTRFNSRLDGIKQKLEQTDKHLDQVKQDIERLNKLNEKFGTLNQRLERSNEDLLNDLDALDRALDKYTKKPSKK